MWQLISDRLIPSVLETVLLVLSFLVPFTIYKINQKLHEKIDPPWKKEDKQKQ